MTLVRKFFTVFILISLSGELKSQPGGGDPNGGGKPGSVPITGIEILIALGGMFGVKKIIGRRKK